MAKQKSVFDDPQADRVPQATPSTLLSMSCGMIPRGADRCFFCGGPCDKDKALRREAHQASFTMPPGRNFQAVAPQSKVICDGCHRSIRKCCTITIPDYDKNGKIIDYYQNKGRPFEMGNMRDFSWIITAKKSFGCRRPRDTKFMGDFLTKPPKDQPWAAVLSDGKYSYIHKGRVNKSDQGELVVTLNGDIVTYTVLELKRRIEMSERVMLAILGCNSFEESKTAVESRYKDGGNMFQSFMKTREEPESRLAAWLCREPAECSAEHEEQKA